jgi:hypothetical protein
MSQPGSPSNRHSPSTGAAVAITDAESGTEGADKAEDLRKSLYALKVMHDRGLLPKEQYEAEVVRLTCKGG